MKEVIQKRWLWRRDQTHKFRSIFTRFGRSQYISRQMDDRINMTEGRHSNKKLSVLEFCVSSCLDWQRSLMSTSWMTECVYVNMAKRTMLASVAMTDNFLSRLPDDLWTHGGSWTVIGRVRTSSVASLSTAIGEDLCCCDLILSSLIEIQPTRTEQTAVQIWASSGLFSLLWADIRPCYVLPVAQIWQTGADRSSAITPCVRCRPDLVGFVCSL